MATTAELLIKADSKQVTKARDELGRFVKGAGKAETASEKFSKSTKRLGLSIKGMGAAFAVAGAAIGAGLLFRSAIQNTIEQERVTAQLNQTLRSTGRFSEELSSGLKEYAASLQLVTTYGDEAIIGSTNLLLTFTKIGEEAFPRAQMAVLDVATAMGTDLKSAAIQVGKALNDPVLGMTALSRSGITFSESQKEAVKQMIATNDVAGAQNLILKELETQFGGSAEAARNTLGGALKGLGNAFGDLLEADGGVNDTASAINDLTDLMSSPEIKAAFQTVAQGAIGLIGFFAQATAHIIEFGRYLGMALGIESFERTVDTVLRLEDEVEKARANIADIETARNKRQRDENIKILAQKEELLAATRKQLEEEIKLKGAQAGGINFSGLNLPPTPISPTGAPAKADLGDIIKVGGQEQITQVDLIKQRYDELFSIAERLNQELRTPIEIYNDEIELLNELKNTRIEGSDQSLLSYENYVRGVEAAQERLEQSAVETTDNITTFWTKAAENIQDELADNLFDFMQGQFELTGDGFKKLIDRMVADALAAEIGGALFGAVGADGKAGGGGLIDQGISFVSGLFGGGRANGGGVSSGKSYLVGERGPEMFTPSQNGSITANEKMGSGMTVNVYVSGVKDEGGLRKTAAQIAQSSGMAAQRATSRNG